MKKKILFLLIVMTIISLPVFSIPAKVHASIVTDVVNRIKNVFSFAPHTQLTLTSYISLVSNGDVNHNGKIDGGDIIKFTYIIKNQTQHTYPLSTLITNVNPKELNSIRIVKGIVSINQTKNTITLPNLFIKPEQQQTIIFEATVNFNKNKNQIISTAPELMDQNNKLLASVQKQIIIVQKNES